MLDNQQSSPQVDAQVPIDGYDAKPIASSVMNVDDAAALLTSAERAPRGADRNPQSGQFQPKQPAADVVDIKTAKPVDAKKPEGKEMVGHNGGPDMEDDEFFEWPAEKEGEAPKRVKADEVFQAYEELPKIKAELEEFRKTGAVPPPQIVEVVRATMADRSKLLEALEETQRLVRPVQPDPQNFVDDPEGYRLAMARFQHQTNYINQINAQHQEQLAKHQAEAKILRRAEEAAAEKAIYGFWPEMAKAETRNKEFSDIKNLLGIDPARLLEQTDPSVWQVLNYALAYKRGEKKQAEAVKVVRAKPKLVRGSARQPTTTKADQVSTSINRLAQTGSMDDAAAALGRLFG